MGEGAAAAGEGGNEGPGEPNGEKGRPVHGGCRGTRTAGESGNEA